MDILDKAISYALDAEELVHALVEGNRRRFWQTADTDPAKATLATSIAALEKLDVTLHWILAYLGDARDQGRAR